VAPDFKDPPVQSELPEPLVVMVEPVHRDQLETLDHVVIKDGEVSREQLVQEG